VGVFVVETRKNRSFAVPSFPQVDPIPLPAPVWIFKALEMLTISLHFLAMQMLIGGLIIGSMWAIAGRRKKDQVLIDASGAVASRLPILMTYVINLGVPPLLFAQVLYGRALYTSSVLIGAFWISVVLLLMMSYMCLYHMSNRAGRGKAWGWIGLIGLVVTIKIGLIYSSNMTLMLRPDVWREMYSEDALGAHMNSGDPTVMPRWLFMMLGGLTIGGVGMMFLGLTKRLSAETGEFLRCWGARIAAAGAVVQVVLGFWVISSQPATVSEELGQSTLYVACMVAWVAGAALVLAACLVAQSRAQNATWLWPGVAGALVFVGTLVMAIYRGGIRDATLRGHGFDVWDRAVSSNWIVVGAFLVLFVFGLGAIAWLVSVAFRTSEVEERYA